MSTETGRDGGGKQAAKKKFVSCASYDQYDPNAPSTAGATYTATARVGNAALAGLYELALTTPGFVTVGHVAWNKVSDYLSTGWVPFELNVERRPGGSQATLTVNGVPLSIVGPAYTVLSQVMLLAHTQSHNQDPETTPEDNVRAEWQGVDARFYNANDERIEGDTDTTCAPKSELMPPGTKKKEFKGPVGASDAIKGEEGGGDDDTVRAMYAVGELVVIPVPAEAIRLQLIASIRLTSEDAARKAPPTLGAGQIEVKAFVWGTPVPPPTPSKGS